MPFVVVYDANALYGNAQRDLLIRIAQSGLVQAKWTEQILDEMLSNLGKSGLTFRPTDSASFASACVCRGYQKQRSGHRDDQPEALPRG
jgi:hypothetical protein